MYELSPSREELNVDELMIEIDPCMLREQEQEKILMVNEGAILESLEE